MKILKRRKSKGQGFSLIEVMIVVTIFAILVGAVISLLISTTNFFDMATLDADLMGKAQVAIDRVTEELGTTYRESVGTPTSAGTSYTITYTQVIAWDTSTNQPTYATNASKFEWESAARELRYYPDANNANFTLITGDVHAFKVEQVVTFTSEVRYMIYLTLAKEYMGTPKSEWRTQALQECIYIRKKPD